MAFEKETYNKEESIIEVSNNKGPGECYHTYDKHIQVLSIAASEDKWIKKQDTIKIEGIYYNGELYNLLFLPKDSRFDYQTKIIGNGTMYVYVKRKTFFPRKIKAGTILGEAFLITKVESHFLLLNKEM